MTTGKDFRVQIKIKNNKMLERMEAAGYTSLVKFSKAVGLNLTTVCRYVNMNQVPINKKTGTYLPTFMKIVDFLQCLPEDLFPRHITANAVKGYKTELRINREDLAGSLKSISITPEKTLFLNEARSNLHRVMEQGLTPREHRVLALRFGLHDSEEYTFEEIGEKDRKSTRLNSSHT